MVSESRCIVGCLAYIQHICYELASSVLDYLDFQTSALSAQISEAEQVEPEIASRETTDVETCQLACTVLILTQDTLFS